MLLFAIDFDNTFTADPSLFRSFVALLRAAGHDAIMVTGRSDEGQWGQEVRDAVGDLLPVVFAGRQWKRDAAVAAGYKVSIWVDDMPDYVGRQVPLLAAEKEGAP